MSHMLQRTQRTVDLNRFASINAESPSARVSDKYKFIPTTQALNVLADLGWRPYSAKEARTRIVENQGFQKHTIRLVNESYNNALAVGDTLPQIVLTNSHSGTSAFSLTAGLYRLVCANGLLVDDHTFGTLKVRHSGYQDADIERATKEIADRLPGILSITDSWKSIELSQPEREAFADAAIEMRFDGDKYAVDPKQLLRLNRYTDAKEASTLWGTYNIIQENVIRGGVRQLRTDGSRIRSREVTNIDESNKLNKALWSLASKMAELKA